VYRLLTVSWQGRTTAALERDGALRELPFADVDEIVASAPADVEALAGPELPRGEVRVLPPLRRPGKILCAGGNYPAHNREMGGNPLGDDRVAPYYFLKSANTLVGDGDAVVLPSSARQVDWECELAVVVGRPGRRIPRERALDHVFGYSVFNDVSARDRQRRTDVRFSHDWVAGKCYDTFGPFGPALVPARFVPDWRRLPLRLTVNGEVQQEGVAGEMIHGVEAQIAFLSEILTLEPGDVIATGSPAGVGLGKGQALKPGDLMVAEIEGVGRLTNPVAGED
jgi:2,4-diketo-3-deoxy-L-fuconate hydrolase